VAAARSRGRNVNGAVAPVKSFLRWIGGKRQLTARLRPYLPENINDVRYHEPFAGAASLYFAIRPPRASLSDLNRHLIECYKQVRDNHSRIAAYLRVHARKNSKRYYYQVREQYNRCSQGPAQAARFIYLNQTCFNGVFRVNTNGHFNVPYGDKPNPSFPTAARLRAIARALRGTQLFAEDFEVALRKVRKGDYVYLDPPYPPLNGTAFFTHYTADRFGAANQERLAQAVKRLHKRGARFLMTNAELPSIRRLYGGFRISKLEVTRYVSCKGTRHRVGELVITNYAPPRQR
jgi:DNA adenine methylase